MSSEIPLRGLYYPNKFARIFMLASEEVIGKTELNTALRNAVLDQYIDSYSPDNLERQFDFAHFSALTAGIEKLARPKLARGQMLHIGHASFLPALRLFVPFMGVGASPVELKILPTEAKTKLTLTSMAAFLTNFSDQVTEVIEQDGKYFYTIKKCPVCWGRKSDVAICHVALGLLRAALHWMNDGDLYRIKEIQCHAKGDEHCTFAIER